MECTDVWFNQQGVKLIEGSKPLDCIAADTNYLNISLDIYV